MRALDTIIVWLALRLAALFRTPAQALQKLTGRDSIVNARIMLGASLTVDLLGAWLAGTPAHVLSWNILIWIYLIDWMLRELSTASFEDGSLKVTSSGVWRTGVILFLIIIDLLFGVAPIFAVYGVAAGLAEAWESLFDLAIVAIAWNFLPGGRTIWSALAEKLRVRAPSSAPTS